jgi:hypothetical protein
MTIGQLPPVTIGAVFGDGYVGKAITGVGRIAALNVVCTAVLMTGELANRALTACLQATGLNPDPNNWIVRNARSISSKTGGRPYAYVAEQKDAQGLVTAPAKNATRTLAYQAVAMAALGIIAFDVMTLLGGKAPPVYNKVLTFLGPVRIEDGFYLNNVKNALVGTYVGSKIGL